MYTTFKWQTPPCPLVAIWQCRLLVIVIGISLERRPLEEHLPRGEGQLGRHRDIIVVHEPEHHLP